jgi:hypothetical protein
MTTTRSEEDDYHYQPARSEDTGGKARMRSQERSGVKVFKVDTPRVGTDGLREALMAKYGVKEN